MTEDLTPDEATLLTEGLAALARATAGGGAARGARQASRRLKSNIFETTVPLSWPLPEAAEKVTQVLDADGTLTGRDLQILTGAGAMNANPVVVTVTLSADEAGQVTARIRGVAKEGLIRQRAGEKAARRIADQLAAG
jgi:hypothetical protein